MILVVLLLSTAAISAGIIALLLSSRIEKQLLDYPNERSLHDSPKPRVGGVGLCAGLLISFVALPFFGIEIPATFAYLACGALVVLIISFIDDMKSLSAVVRIPFHFLAAVVLIIAGFSLENVSIGGFALEMPRSLAVIVSLLYVVWMVNLYNFMDGMDGFAGGMSLIGFGTLTLLAVSGGSILIAAVSACAAGAALGFLFYNFPPARVFMGDTGASTLGFLAAGLSLWADREGVIPLWISVLVFSPFIVDATVTLIRRAWRRERVWVAHRSHYYQRLVQAGWGHRRTVVAEYLVMIACGGSALLALGLAPYGQWIVILIWIMLYFVFIVSIHRLNKSKRRREVAESV